MSLLQTATRLLAAAILALLVAALPGGAEAHEGHHGAHAHHAAAHLAQQQGAASAGSARAAALPAALNGLSAIHAGPDRGCCPAPCARACCGVPACCAAGLLAGMDGLPLPMGRPVTLRPTDRPAPPARAPEALPEPPRPAA